VTIEDEIYSPNLIYNDRDNNINNVLPNHDFNEILSLDKNLNEKHMKLIPHSLDNSIETEMKKPCMLNLTLPNLITSFHD
jgi:hypothetical protein